MDSIKIDSLPYRKNVSCIVFKAKKFLLIQNNDWLKNWWKFPQGGVNKGEPLEKAAIRELKEELGTDKFSILGKSKKINQYDWNDKSLELSKYKWRGQIQNYLIVEFIGEENEIKIDSKEIRQYKWVTVDDLWPSIDHDDKNFTNYKTTLKEVFKEFNLAKRGLILTCQY